MLVRGPVGVHQLTQYYVLARSKRQNQMPIAISDHSPTHFRDPGGSEDLFKKKPNFFEGEVLMTNGGIRCGIFEAFTDS